MFCLPKFEAQEVLRRLKSGELDPEALSKMDSASRREAFSFLGDKATRVNALFESKLIQKNQVQGFKTWAKQILGESTPQYRDAISRIERLGEEIMSPAAQDAFLQDLVGMRLNVEGVTRTEAAKLLELEQDVRSKEANLPKRTQDAINSPGITKEYLKTETAGERAQRLEYGWAMVRFKNYFESIHPLSKPKTLKDFLAHPVIESLELAKTLVATWDNSFFGNQGIATLLDPRTSHIWVNGLVRSFGDIAKVLRGGSALDAIRADVYSRPDAINGTYTRQGLAIGLRKEETLPSSLPENILNKSKIGTPLARLFDASSQAYSGAALRLRADLADRLNSIARKQGRDITDKDFSRDLGGFINNVTGRGSLGAAEGILKKLNAVAFSPRLLAGTWRTLTSPFNRNLDPFVRRQAQIKIVSMGLTYLGLMQIIESLYPNSTDTDPRSAHFGQVNIGGNRWVNTLGPFRTIIRTVAQITPQYINGKWSFVRRTTGGKWIVQPLSEVPKFGEYVPLDAVEGFFEGKASPGLSVVLDLLRRKTFEGKPNTPESVLTSLTVPMTLEQALSSDSEETDAAVSSILLNGLGFGVTNYK